MRILYAATADLTLFRAHNVHIYRMCEALTSQNANVSLIVKRSPSRKELREGFSSDCEFEIIETKTSTGKLAVLLFALRVVAEARKHDVVLTRNLPVALGCALSGRKVLLELHGSLEDRRSEWFFKTLTGMRGFVGLIVVTRALKERFLSQFGEALRDRIHVLPDGAIATWNPPGDPIELSRPAIGYVGSFLPGKGVEQMLEVARQVPEATFYFVGGDFAQLAIPGGMSPRNARFIAPMPHNQALTWIDAFDIVLLPNQRRVMVTEGRFDIGKWTSPLKLFEYMAAGKAIVASRIDVLQEVLETGRNCLLADPENPLEWAECIRSIIRNNDKARALGERARQDFQVNFSWSTRARRILDIAGAIT